MSAGLDSISKAELVASSQCFNSVIISWTCSSTAHESHVLARYRVACEQFVGLTLLTQAETETDVAKYRRWTCGVLTVVLGSRANVPTNSVFSPWYQGVLQGVLANQDVGRKVVKKG